MQPGVRVAINGLGRIGRAVLKIGWNRPDIEWVAINDLADAGTLAHLFKCDSVFGPFPGKVEGVGNNMVIDGRSIPVTAHRDPFQLPWKELGIDIVLESSGRLTDADQARAHLSAGAGRVIISAVSDKADLTVCMGINEERFEPGKHRILSNASCTTNCLATMAQVLMESFGIRRGWMTTVHCLTNGQVVQDSPPHDGRGAPDVWRSVGRDLRRSRAADASIIPTSTNADKAIGFVLPELRGKLKCLSVRVPTPNVSLVDLTVELGRSVTREEINAVFQKAAASKLGKVLGYSDVPLVSRDFLQSPKSCIFDATLTQVIEGSLAKVIGWYDNEWGYSNRVVDLIVHIACKARQIISQRRESSYDVSHAGGEDSGCFNC
jgi:glyceraldehyde 3-phosphate dehydrogenase